MVVGTERDKINNDGWNESDRTNMNERGGNLFKGKGPPLTGETGINCSLIPDRVATETN